MTSNVPQGSNQSQLLAGLGLFNQSTSPHNRSSQLSQHQNLQLAGFPSNRAAQKKLSISTESSSRKHSLAREEGFDFGENSRNLLNSVAIPAFGNFELQEKKYQSECSDDRDSEGISAKSKKM